MRPLACDSSYSQVGGTNHEALDNRNHGGIGIRFGQLCDDRRIDTAIDQSPSLRVQLGECDLPTAADLCFASEDERCAERDRD